MRTGFVFALVAFVVVSGCSGVNPGPADATPSTNAGTTSTSEVAPTETETATTRAMTETPGSSDSGTGPNVSVEDVTVAPGETRNLTIHGHDVGEMLFQWDPGNQDLTFDSPNATFSPNIHLQVDTLPPYWVWPTVEPTVTVTVPIRAAADATPGTYRYPVTVWADTNHTHANGATANATITVAES